jgi:hypothetical protein
MYWPSIAVLSGACAAHPSGDEKGTHRGRRPGEWGVAAGPAAISPNFDEGSVGGSVELACFVTEHSTIAMRHIGDYEDDNNDTSINVSRLGYDWSPSCAELETFVGGSLGAAYGESVNESGLVGAHAGLRYWRQPRAFLQVIGGYDRFWTRTEDRSEYYREGVFTFLLGVGQLF